MPFRASEAHRLPKSARYVSARRGEVKAKWLENRGFWPRDRATGASMIPSGRKRSGRPPGQARHLALDQAAVHAAAVQENLRRSILADLARLQHDDPVEAAQRRQPMG